MGIKRPNSLTEHVERIKYLSKYSLKEARYSLVNELEQDDTIPEEIWSEPSHVSPVSPNNSNVMEAEPSPEEIPTEDPMAIPGEGEPEMGMEDPAMGGEEMGMEDPTMGMEQPMPEEPASPSVDEIQNDILKTSVSTMQKMNDEIKNLESTLGGLESTLGGLNSKIDSLNKDVDEVKEPTNVEKLMSRKDDSHPFYYNLNDMWEGNWFQARRQVEDSEGMKKTEDGEYIADFDGLPKFTDQEINDSF